MAPSSPPTPYAMGRSVVVISSVLDAAGLLSSLPHIAGSTLRTDECLYTYSASDTVALPLLWLRPALGVLPDREGYTSRVQSCCPADTNVMVDSLVQSTIGNHFG